MKHKIFGYIFIILVASAVVAGIYHWQKLQEQPIIVPVQKDETETWKTYRNDKFEFRYPPKLSLTENNDEVSLSHSIAYENNGDCDMSVVKTSENLQDFGLVISKSPSIAKAPYIDGQINAGELSGNWAYQGAEGCGDIHYYFPWDSNTLLIKRANIQALSGISSNWDREEILKVPGVISKTENDKIFNQILATFKFIN